MREIQSKFGIKLADGKTKEIGQGTAVTKKEWTQDEVEAVQDTLESLPGPFRKCTRNVQRVEDIKWPAGKIDGLHDPSSDTIYMADYAPFGLGYFKAILVHEMTHGFQGDDYPAAENLWAETFWRDGKPKTSSVSDYGNSQPAEDMADSVAAYWANGPRMKETHPDRYAFIRDRIFGGVEYREVNTTEFP